MKKREENFPEMTTREAVLSYGLSLPDTYQDAPFHFGGKKIIWKSS